MTPQEGLARWLAARRAADAPAGFADRVMAEVRRDRAPAVPAGPVRATGGRRGGRWLGMAAAVAGAAAVWLARAALHAALLAGSRF